MGVGERGRGAELFSGASDCVVQHQLWTGVAFGTAGGRCSAAAACLALLSNRAASREFSAKFCGVSCCEIEGMVTVVCSPLLSVRSKWVCEVAVREATDVQHDGCCRRHGRGA
eukprot:2707562-Rhodomonas_salina.2